MSTNGVGMGHLAGTLGIGRRLDRDDLQPVFLTLSQAAPVVAEQGFLGEYLPFHGYLRCDNRRWNLFLRHELDECIAFYRPGVLVFDGMMPYRGLIDAIGAHPDLRSLWVRHAMWRHDAEEHGLKRERHFDAVIEPDELAAAVDAGPTRRYRDRTHAVAPLRFLDEDELPPREEARRELGLGEADTAALIQLGSGTNFDVSAVRERAVRHLLRRGARVVLAEWLIADSTPAQPPGVTVLRTFPLGRFLRAFDFAVSAAGHGAYHELLLAGIPTLFVPNENPLMDDQFGRARYAEGRGLGLCVRASDLEPLEPRLDVLLRAAERDRLRDAMGRLRRGSGAAEAARLIERFAGARTAPRGRSFCHSG